MNQSSDRTLFQTVGYIIIGFLSLLCLLPLLLVLTGSLMEEQEVIRSGYSLWPKHWTLSAYKLVFEVPGEIINATVVSVSLVVFGTTLGVFMTAMTGYVLQRKDVKYRNMISFYIYFTSVFSGGLVPYYIIMVNYLDMKNNYLALLLPLLLSVFNILVMKSFLSSIPDAIVESGKLDGASELTIFIKLILPISKPALATIGLFIALAYWNDWFSAMLFISDQKLIPLQFYLYNILNKTNALSNIAALSGLPMEDVPKETVKLAMTMLAVVPILFVYPFVQKYVVNGVTLGAVKG
jgi:putative aldouronate transport system permease protein